MIWNTTGKANNNNHTDAPKKSRVTKCIEENFTGSGWTNAYTDRSPSNAAEEGEVFLVLNHGQHRRLSLATEKCSSSFRAEIVETPVEVLISEKEC